MRRESPTSRLSALYKFLWGFPLRGRFLALSALSAATASIGLLALSELKPHLLLIPLFFTLSSIIWWIPEELGIELGLLNARRANQLTLLNSIILVSGSLLSMTPIGIAVLMVSATIGSFLRVLVWGVFASGRIAKVAPLALSSFLLEAGSSAFLLIEHGVGMALSLGYTMGAALGALFITLSSKLIKVRGISVMSYLSATLSVLLNGRYELLEEIVSKLEDHGRITVDILLFKADGEEKPELVVLVPTFHAGPFRKFGSSGLPYKISQLLEEAGVQAIFFKGFSNHESNIISSEDCERIASSIRECVVKGSENREYYHLMGPPQVITNQHVKTSIIPFGGAKIALITLHPYGMEDIPPSIAKNINDDSLIPIDCHNSFSESINELDGESLQSISKLLKEIEVMKAREVFRIQAGYAIRRYGDGRLEEGMGELGISALILKAGLNKIALISLDGNNCLPGVRNAIEKRLRRLGFSFVEVVTTDTHAVSGLRFGGRGYHPLGEVISAEELAEEVEELVKKASESLKPFRISHIRLDFDGVKVMSYSFLRETERAAYRGLKLFLLFFAAIILSAVMLFLFSFRL